MSHHTPKEERNLALVREFFDTVIMKFDTDAMDRFVRPDYIQHAPDAATGRAGLKAFLEGKRAQQPPGGVKFDIKRMFADGDHVVVHHHVHWAGFRGLAVIDIIRVEDGMLAEHWDVIQPIPEESLNENTMF